MPGAFIDPMHGAPCGIQVEAVGTIPHLARQVAPFVSVSMLSKPMMKLENALLCPYFSAMYSSASRWR